MECRDNLANLADKVRNDGGMFVQDLAEGDLLEIETENSIYFFQVINPPERILRLIGQTKNTWKIKNSEKISLIAHGSSLNNKGDFIRTGWIRAGYRFCAGDYMLSPTKLIKVNNILISFPPFYKLN